MPDPLLAHRAMIQSLRWQAEEFLRSNHNGSASSSPLVNSIHREAFGGIGAVISGELFGRRGIGANIGRALAKNAQHAQRLRAQQTARSAADSIVQQARHVVQATTSIIGPQLSRSLGRVLAEAESAHRPETAVRKVVQVLGRLESWQPTASSSKMEGSYPESLHTLERGLRRCIEARLSAIASNWWNERIPTEVRARADRRKSLRERVWPWLDAGEHALVEYLEFPDYVKIILEPQNWAQAFSAVFIDAEALKVKLRELEPIRNDIAHSRELTSSNRDRLRLYSRELVAQMEPRGRVENGA